MATEDSIISAVTFRSILETDTLYKSADVDALLTREREAAITRENALKDLIQQNDDCFDDICTALNDVVDLEDLPSDTSTMLDVLNRVNLLTKCLKKVREGVMD